MNGVDLADQYRSYYKVQLVARRNWFPLFYGIVDIAIINSYLLACTALSPPQSQKLTHRIFREQLSEALVKRGYEDHHSWDLSLSSTTARLNAQQLTSYPQSPPAMSPSSSLVKKVLMNISRASEDLPGIRFMRGKHIAIESTSRFTCYLCRYELRRAKLDATARRTKYFCSMCAYPLCNTPGHQKVQRTCHQRFHTPNLK